MAHAWKACWVQALGGSNPPSSATVQSEVEVQQTSFRSRRLEQRKRIIQFSAIALAIFVAGYGIGWISHRPTFSPVEGSTPVPCLTLAIIPADVLPKPKTVTINVLNGSKRMGIARIAGEIFGGLGFKVGNVGNFNDYEVSDPAEIHYGKTGAKQAQLVAAYIEGAKLVEDERTDNSVDVIVGQAFDQIRNNSEARKELLRPSASPSGPGC